MPAPAAIYLQELALGIPWTLGHCPAMCGPLLLALRFGARPGTPSATIGTTLTDLVLHQGGRLVIYVAVGAVAGALGKELTGAWRWGGVTLAGLVALALVMAAVRQVPAVGRMFPPLPGQKLLQHAFARLVHLRSRRPLLGGGLTGALLAGLPCGVAAWALALAAATASPWHGAGVMVVLVAMTSVPLALTLLAPLAGRRLGWRAPRWLVPVGLVLSAVLMVALAVSAARAEPACPLCAVGHG